MSCCCCRSERPDSQTLSEITEIKAIHRRIRELQISLNEKGFVIRNVQGKTVWKVSPVTDIEVVRPPKAMTEEVF